MAERRLTKVLLTEPKGDLTEACWVEVLTGTPDDGTGILANKPIGKQGATLGDKIKFSGGTSKTWPRFGGKL